MPGDLPAEERGTLADGIGHCGHFGTPYNLFLVHPKKGRRL
jgi:hypothetical protein